MSLTIDRFRARAQGGLAGLRDRAARLWAEVHAQLTAPPVLAPYTPDARRWTHYLWRGLAMASVIGFCLLYGMAFSLFAPGLTVALLAPLGVLILVGIWSLPESKAAPIAQTSWLFFMVLGSTILWPNYLSIAIPGLPWITVARLFGVPMALGLLICISTSKPFRQRLAQVMEGAGVIWRLFVVFIGFQVFAVVISPNPFYSLDQFLTAQLRWTAMFVMGVYVFSFEGAALRWTRLIWISATIVCLIALAESKVQHVLWRGHIPSFLQINDPSVEAAIAGYFRGAQYRAQATFDGSIQLAEFLSLALAFIVHATMTTKSLLLRVLGALSVPFILLVEFLSGSRSGMMGSLLTPILYAFYWLYREWRRRKASLLAPGALLAYPFTFLAILPATFLIPFFNHRLWLRGNSASSALARTQQWAMGIPKILSHPWGYGVGESGNTLQYYTPGGANTVDTYPLTLLLDYGVLGAAVWFAIFLFAIGQGGLLALDDDGQDPETSYLAPAVISLICFLVVKSVFSQTDNHSLFYAVLGMTAAMIWRRERYLKEPGVVFIPGSPVPVARLPNRPMVLTGAKPRLLG